MFDQSHIFFDGTWGAAVAEVLTNEAIHWYKRLQDRPPSPQTPPPLPLRLVAPPQAEAIAQPHTIPIEVSAESDGVDAQRLFRVRDLLRQRGVRLTINDLLLLARHFHAAGYHPTPTLQRAIEALCRSKSPQAQDAGQTIQSTLDRLQETNPALLIPMDASNVAPRERVFPTTFRNPLADLRERFETAYKQYRSYIDQPNPQRERAFDQARRELLAYLNTFGNILDTLKAVTMRGESFNTATIRLLAHLPPSMQHLMDQIPQRIGVLNEIIKGDEVFSNLGRVAPGSSLTRFISAKDDGQTKILIWGVLTDDQGRMHITMRDYRPFLSKLLALGETALANSLAQDYLDNYVATLNWMMAGLEEMTLAKARGGKQEAESEKQEKE